MSDSMQHDLSGKADELLRGAKEKVGEVKDNVTQMAKENLGTISETAAELADKAKQGVSASVERQKSAGADYIEMFARATHRAAGEFETDLPHAATLIRQASAGVQTVADRVRGKNAQELVGDVQDFARRQPTLFFGGAVVLGFAALRFLKSAAPKSEQQG